ncbi:lipase domain-containing protein [Phthorimaea operculella]|nr:lipase domain-containing protein [Phthorimaea operculella]
MANILVLLACGLAVVSAHPTKNALEFSRFNPDLENEYHLFTRANPSLSQPLLFGNAGLLATTNYDTNKRTVVIIHGWLNSVTGTVNTVLVPAFLQGADVNVIVVDWYAGARDPDYEVAVQNTVTSGQSVARFLNWLLSATGQNPINFHVIGHSLGGHQAGIVGRNMREKPGYVTALDPAGPSWHGNPNRFASTDGDYTEVIYTNAGALGHTDALGMSTFYPNGGSRMAGCGDDGCDHDRAFWYMAESLTTGGFFGTECASVDEARVGNCNLPGRLRMGGPNPKTGASGIFYLETNAAPPFSRG